MHFFPQVLITANAWGAGFKHQPGQKNEAPDDIRDTYDAFRRRLENNKAYERALALVNQIEGALVALNSELATIDLPDDPQKLPDDMEDDLKNDIKAACSLLEALDLEHTKWKIRIKGYG